MPEFGFLRRLGPTLRAALSSPVVVLTVLLLVFLAAMVASFLYAQAQGRFQSQYDSVVLEQDQLAEEISAAAIQAASGKTEAYDRLQRLTREFEQTLEILENGDPSAGLPPLPERYALELEAVQGAWRVEQVNLDAIAAGRESVQQITSNIAEIRGVADELLAQTGTVVDQLVARDVSPERIQLVSRQLWLLQRALGALDRVLAAGGEAQAAAETFARDAALYGRVLDGLLQGSQRLGIEPVTDPEVRATLRDVAINFAAVRRHIGAIRELAPELRESVDTYHADDRRHKNAIRLRSNASDSMIRQSVSSVPRVLRRARRSGRVVSTWGRQLSSRHTALSSTAATVVPASVWRF